MEQLTHLVAIRQPEVREDGFSAVVIDGDGKERIIATAATRKGLEKELRDLRQNTTEE